MAFCFTTSSCATQVLLSITQRACQILLVPPAGSHPGHRMIRSPQRTAVAQQDTLALPVYIIEDLVRQRLKTNITRYGHTLTCEAPGISWPELFCIVRLAQTHTTNTAASTAIAAAVGLLQTPAERSLILLLWLLVVWVRLGCKQTYSECGCTIACKQLCISAVLCSTAITGAPACS